MHGDPQDQISFARKNSRLTLLPRTARTREFPFIAICSASSASNAAFSALCLEHFMKVLIIAGLPAAPAPVIAPVLIPAPSGTPAPAPPLSGGIPAWVRSTTADK